MFLAYRAFAPVAAVLLASMPAQAEVAVDPLRFFEGRTESRGTVKPVFRKAFRSQSVGRGRIEPDGTLVLVQQVREDNKPVKERRWRIRKTGPGRMTGTMSEAIGPVTIDKVGEGYRFRFRMKGNLSVEQWVTPLPGGKSASSRMTVRKLGVRVATGESTITKS